MKIHYAFRRDVLSVQDESLFRPWFKPICGSFIGSASISAKEKAILLDHTVDLYRRKSLSKVTRKHCIKLRSKYPQIQDAYPREGLSYGYSPDWS